MAAIEPIIEPELAIVDPHHHLWFWSEDVLATASPSTPDDELVRYVQAGVRERPRYLIEELMADLTSGHDVRATVFIEAGAMYRRDGPEELRSIGEIEFATGAAAMAASGSFGDVKACAGIVGSVDLRLGAKVQEILEAHVRVSGGRYRGVRRHTPWDARFRTGFARLADLELSFDAFVRAPQLPELIELSRAFPETQIVLNHAGSPPPISSDGFASWRTNLHILSTCANVAVKLGGLRLQPAGRPPFSSEQLATEWRPYVEACIDAFGPNRCMFESDYPASAGLVAAYPVIWNAFKRLAADMTLDEKRALLSCTATRVYRLEI